MRSSVGLNINVTATEKWLQALQAGQGFTNFANVAAVAAQFTFIQIFNPGGSGRTVLVRSFIMQMGAATFFYTAFDNTARTTDAGAGINLLSGGAAGVAHVRSETNAADSTTHFGLVAVPINQAFSPPIEWFAQLAPGQGMSCVSALVNQTLYGQFYWLEL